MSVFTDWLGSAATTAVWIEYEAYARRVFANSPPHWYGDPVRYSATLIQAQSAIASHCLSVDILAPFLSGLEASGAPRDATAIVDSLGAGAHAEFVDQALDALLHRFGGRLDLFLKLRAPADLVEIGDNARSFTFDDLDDLSTAMSDFVRPLADKPVTGLLLEKRGDVSLSADEADAYEPIIAAARHYDWVTAMSCPDVTSRAIAGTQLDIDVLLLPQLALEQIAREATAPRIGGGLTDAYWHGAPISAEDASGRLLYGCIPESANPETVLSVLRALV
jgi:hypothetical protein